MLGEERQSYTHISSEKTETPRLYTAGGGGGSAGKFILHNF